MLTYALLAVAVLAILLGFVALLKQKTYIDSATNQPSEFELPLVGKLKTNYPSLLFVALGFGIVWQVAQGLDAGTEEWSITGSLRADSAAPAWEQGTLTVFPSDFRVELSNQGAFRMTADLPRVPRSRMWSTTSTSRTPPAASSSPEEPVRTLRAA